MNLDKEKLPDGWELCQSKSNPGRKYYFNRKTGRSSWTKPEASSKSGSGKKFDKGVKRIQEKSKKEELRKKSLKRKSDGNGDGPSKEKCRKVTPQKDQRSKTNEVQNNNVQSNNEHNKSKTASPHKPTPTKNLANTRLSELRNQLAIEAEIEKDESNEALLNRSRHSPKSNVATPVKNQKTESNSPSLNESKCSTTSQSPTSDNLTAVSPSQFFAANKIISSMKAQLPEEYTNKEKQKDTFADIEHGICNQMPEYPYNKHPATPPQFSEASKLVSAIKSKLAYKIPHESGVQTFTSAKDRMEALRTSLTLESSNTSACDFSINDSVEDERHTEEMEVDNIKETEQSLPQTQSASTNLDIVQDNIVLVVDTNIFIHELDFIKNVLNLHIKGYSEQPTLLVPWRVVNELDRLKDNNNGKGALCKRAKAAMDYLYKSLPENSRIKGQSLRDANSHIFPCEVPDDEILNCCLQQAERGKSVLLLSNDKNLCNKAIINGIKRIGLEELRPLLESKPQPVVDPGLYTSVKHYESTMYQLLANILESEMRAQYAALWRRVVCRPPPWSLGDVLRCLLAHWAAVFREVFPRIRPLLAELQHSLACVRGKGSPSALTIGSVEFQRAVHGRCQEVPNNTRVHGTGQSHSGEAPAERAELSTCLGIQHGLERRLHGNQTLEELAGKCAAFRNPLNALCLAIDGVLGLDNWDQIMDEQILRLECALRDSLAVAELEPGRLSRDDLRTFCERNRNMLQEASSKLSQLTDLFDACRNKIQY